MVFFFLKKKNKKNTINLKTLNHSSNLISHRGPDSSRVFNDEDIYIKFFRLSIQDLSKNAMQPMLSWSKKNLIVFNGEIYNFKELRKYIDEKKLKSRSDTEVLINLYEKIGNKIFDKIEGMYSFLIYNFETKKILAARDNFGIKPLYFYEDKDDLIFSSEIKPILKYKKYFEYEISSLSNFLLLGKQDNHSQTFFKNIKSIEPSHYYYFFHNGKKQKYNYWSIYKKNFKQKTDAEHINELYSLIDSKLNNYLISDKRIGLFLSSGTDSSSLASYISNKIDYKLDTFTYDFDDADSKGESSQVNKIAKILNVKNYKYILKPKIILNQFDFLTLKLESPFTSIRLFAVDGLYAVARNKKYNVIIEGAGGDEILGGYNYNFFPSIIEKNKPINKIVYELINFVSKSKKKFEVELINRIATLFLQGASTTDATPYVDINCFDKDYLDTTIDESFYYSNKDKNTDFKKMNNLQKSQILDIEEIKLPRNLKFTDRISMNQKIETRLPLLDPEISKYCFNLRNSLKYKDYTSRWIMKQALKKTTKKIKIEKNKKSVVDPQTKWLKTHLKEYFLIILAHQVLKT